MLMKRRMLNRDSYYSRWPSVQWALFFFFFKKILKRVGLIIYYIIQGSQTHVFLNLKFPEVILTTELLKQLAIGPSPPN